jgi:hypothetical protein
LTVPLDNKTLIIKYSIKNDPKNDTVKQRIIHNGISICISALGHAHNVHIKKSIIFSPVKANHCGHVPHHTLLRKNTRKNRVIGKPIKVVKTLARDTGIKIFLKVILIFLAIHRVSTNITKISA